MDLRCLALASVTVAGESPELIPVPELARRAKAASRALATASTATKDQALRAAADLLEARTADLLAAIAGEFRSDVDDANDPPAVERDDGSWLFSGALPADEMADRLGFDLEADRDYETVAGFVLEHVRHLPETGESFIVGHWRFEIVDMDGRKVDKVLASAVKAKVIIG